MFSKRPPLTTSRSFASLFLLQFLICSGLIMITGCDKFLYRQGPGRSTQFELKTEALTCLRPIPDRISNWLQDNLPPEDIKISFECLRTTIHHFQARARGYGNSEYLTSEALRSYVNEALPSNRQIDRVFMSRLMRLKTVFLGGSAEVMTRPELNSMLDFLDGFQDQFLKLNGHLRVLLFQEDLAKVNRESLREIENLVSVAAQSFLDRSHIAGASYDMQDLQDLIDGFDAYLGQPKLLQRLRHWMPFTQSMKNLFMGRYLEFSSQTSWKDHVQWVVQSYGTALNFYYRIRPLKYETTRDFDELIDWVNGVFELAENSRSIREYSLLKMPDILDVVSKIPKPAFGSISTDVQDALPETLCKVVSYFVEGSKKSACREVPGISQAGLDIIRHEWNVWALAQKQIHSTFQDSNVATWESFMKAMVSFNTTPAIQSLFHRPAEERDLDRSYYEWTKIVQGFTWTEMVDESASTGAKYPTLWDPTSRMLVKRVTPLDLLGLNGMTRVNAYRSLTRLIMRGFGTPPPRDESSIFQYTLSRANLERLESEFRLFGRAIRFLDPRTPNAAARTFLEASLFTPHGRGADSLSAQEVFEELNILVSAGGETSEAIYALLHSNDCPSNPALVKPKNCTEVTEYDALGRAYSERSVFLAALEKNFDRVFGSVQGLREISILPEQERKQFFADLLEFAKIPGNESQKKIGFGEIRTMSTVLYYIELVRLVYDANHDGKLSVSEVKQSLPRFKSFLVAAIKKETGKDNKGAEAYAENTLLCLVFKQTKSKTCAFTGVWGDPKVGLPELLKVLGFLKESMPK